MYHVHGFGMSFNTTKVLYVAAEVGVEFDITSLDLSKGEHKSPEHLARHPGGKTPTLTHNGRSLFESAAICRYIAAEEGSALYPEGDVWQRAQIDQWVDFFACHPGRWLGTLLFERAVREKFGMGEPKQDVIDEALGFLEGQMRVVDDQLANNTWLAGNDLSIADPFAFAYVETTAMSGFSLEPYPNVARWLESYASRPSVAAVRERLAS